MSRVKRRKINYGTGLTSPNDPTLLIEEQKLFNELQEEVVRLRKLEKKLLEDTNEVYDDSEVRAEIESMKSSVRRYIRNLEALGFKP